MSNIHNVLYDKEEILWEGKPEKAPYMVGAFFSSIPLFLFGIPFAAIPLFMHVMSNGSPMSWMIFVMPHFWVGLGLMFGPIISAVLSYPRINYAITNRRVMIESGVFNYNIKTIDNDQISNATVNVSIVDGWYGGTTGTIMLSEGLANIMYVRTASAMSRLDCLLHIKDPYTVFKFFGKLEVDTKTDMQYPNALRPSSNPGYQTTIDDKFPKQ